MNQAELERLTVAAAELTAIRARVDEDGRLRAEARRERELIAAVAPLLDLLQHSRARLTVTVRLLERQWVAQAPAESAWQRALELEQVAVAAGADAAAPHRDSERARAVAESARAESRAPLAEVRRERALIETAATAPPIGLDPPPPGRRDDRPQAGRRDALALLDYAARAGEAAELLAAGAGERLDEIRLQLDRLAVDDAARERLEELARTLPQRVALPAGAPPSLAARLQRAGVAVEIASA